MSRPQLWGGVECTVNRLGDRWRDQLRLTGHHDHPDDLDRFVDLGLEAIRYPILWERTEITRGRWDWIWADRRMAHLRRLGMRPIVGLVHHGSGPAWTNLLDAGFASGLARHAGRVARRYPWVRDWTPVNEPLTTARFSALYGHWYPHHRSEASLLLALFNQVEATVKAMAAIRAVIPNARLIQTEDLGHCTGSTDCADQVRFENDRRWLTWDLLLGCVDRAHPLWNRLVGFGLEPRMQALLDTPCPPDAIGINHYVTSDRFLDQDANAYPAHLRGGNGKMAYADVETVRVEPPQGRSWRARLDEAHRRYDRPLAITECHLGGEPADQLAWLQEGWQAAVDLNRSGGRVEAVTVWSLVGGVDWDSLLTRDAGHVEEGAFKRTTEGLIDTPLAGLCRQLSGMDPGVQDHPPGWWARPCRVLYPHASKQSIPAAISR